MRIPYRGAGVVFLRRQGTNIQVFLGKRSKRPFFGFYAIPGGGFEKTKDSSDFECACRETLEETNVNLKEMINNNACSVLGEKEIKFPLFSWRSFFCQIYDFSYFEKTVPNEFSSLDWYNIDGLERTKLRSFTSLEIKRAVRLCKDLRWHKNV